MSEVIHTSHKVIVDCDDEKHAIQVQAAMANDGYRVSREVHRFKRLEDQTVTLERERVGVAIGRGRGKVG